MNNRSRAAVLVSASIASILHHVPVWAQEAQSEAVAGGIEEVVVTARKRSEAIESVPLAITAISATQIQDAGMLDIADVGLFTPGFKDQTQSVDRNDRGFRTYTIRGIISGNALSTRQTVSVFVDGVLNFGGNVSNLTDVDHIEVVKGPQAAYFGRGTFAGAINFVTRAPSLTEWQGKASVDAGSYDSLTAAVSAEGPVIADKLAIRVAAESYYTGGDYQDYGWPGTELGQRGTKSLSASILFKPVDSLTVRSYITQWTDSDGPAANGAETNANWNCNGGAAPAGQLNYYCGAIRGWSPTTQTRATYVDPVSFNALQHGNGQPNSVPYLGPNFVDHMGLERHAWTTRNLFDYDLGNGYTLSGNVSVDSNKWGFLQSGSYQDTRNVPNPLFGIIPDVLPYQNILIIGNTSDQDYNGELRISSPVADRFNWSLGVNYFHDITKNQTCVYLFAGNIGCVSPYEELTNSTPAVFAAANYSFTSTFSASVEGRYQSDKQGDTSFGGTTQSASNTDKVFTPRASLQYKPTERSTYYVSYAEGSLPVEFNTNTATLTAAQQAQIAQQAQVGLIVPHDKIRMEEIGAKGLYFDNSLQLLAAAYTGQWTGRHIPQSVTFSGPNNTIEGLVVVSAGGVVDMHGIELEGTYKATEKLTLEGTFAWNATDIRRTYSSDALILTGSATPTGTQLPLYPAETGTFSVTYRTHAFADYDTFTRLDYFYTSKIYDSEANLAWTPPTNRLNLGIGIVNARYRIELYGKNITNDLGPTSLQRSQFAIYDSKGNQIASPNGIAFALADRPVYGIRASANF